jgi:sugar/nucleoside kinase (ribokinase family)
MKGEIVVFVGNLAKDINITQDGKRRENFGGSAYSTSSASALVKTNEQTIGVSSWVGEDEIGQAILSALIQKGVDSTGILETQDQTLMFEVTEKADTSAEREFKEDVEKRVRINPVLPEKYLSARYVHLGAALPEQQLLWLKTFISQLSPQTQISVDAFEAYAKQNPEETLGALNHATAYVFLNDEEWKILEDWGKQSRKFDKLSFPVPVILKHGEKGASIIYPDGDSVHIPAKKVNFVNGTGAGDTLAGVFLTLRAQNIDEKTALGKAVEIATLSVTNFGIDHLYERNTLN